jgi:hypothetical protein
MRQAIIMGTVALLFCVGTGVGQDALHLKPPRIVIEGRTSIVHVRQPFTTMIRLPEPVNSVVVGDPALFQAEHSPSEPLLVFVKPVSAVARSNLLISTTTGRQFSLLLQSDLDTGRPDSTIDLLVVCQTSGSFFIEERYSGSLIAETLALGASIPSEGSDKPDSPDSLSDLLDEQRRSSTQKFQGEGLKVSVGRVMERDSHFVALFSVVNGTGKTIELMPPQVQLAGSVKSGLFGHSSRWTTVDQIPLLDFRLDQRKLPPGARADGLVVFDRPSLKQSHESLLLQIADAARVDQPVLAPITFTVSRVVEE